MLCCVLSRRLLHRPQYHHPKKEGAQDAIADNVHGKGGGGDGGRFGRLVMKCEVKGSCVQSAKCSVVSL